MKPVRIVSPGMSPTLPLRMVAAGTGANVDITLFVIGEGAWVPQNFPVGSLSASDLTWDFKDASSNYAVKRKDLLALQNGRTWNEAYSIKSTLLSPRVDESTGGNITYQVDDQFPDTIAAAYVAQGIKNGEATDSSCLGAFANHASSLEQVVNLCGEAGEVAAAAAPRARVRRPGAARAARAATARAAVSAAQAADRPHAPRPSRASSTLATSRAALSTMSPWRSRVCTRATSPSLASRAACPAWLWRRISCSRPLPRSARSPTCSW